MTPEVKDALVHYRASENAKSDWGVTLRADDCRILASAFAAEHPADDDSPVTVEALMGLGFARQNRGGLYDDWIIYELQIGYAILGYTPHINAWWIADNSGDGESASISLVKTIGQLRSLIRGLGGDAELRIAN